jgi:hypothetical protein
MPRSDEQLSTTTSVNVKRAASFRRNASITRSLVNGRAVCHFALRVQQIEATQKSDFVMRACSLSIVASWIDDLEYDGATVFKHVCKMGLEGIVSKRRDAPYHSGRSKSWSSCLIRGVRRYGVIRKARSKRPLWTGHVFP